MIVYFTRMIVYFQSRSYILYDRILYHPIVVKLKTNPSQFLVTEDYRIVANDLDDLPEVIPDNLPNCTWGKVEDRDPSFQSPEEKSYSPNNPSPFTDKADVWKLVNMTKFIMYKVS